MATKVKKDIWFHYLLTEIQLYTFIKDKSTTDNIFRIQDDESIMFRIHCTAFI